MAQTAVVLNFEDYRLHAFERHGSKLPWFVLAEVCEVLELKGRFAAKDAAERLDDDEKGRVTIPTPGGSQQMLCVSLSGLTRLAGTSRKPVAKRFNKWLHSDVVVSIFLTGEFKGDSSPLQELVGSFQPLLDLPEPAAKPADVLRFPSPDNTERNQRHIEALVGERRLASTWAGDVPDEPVLPNPLIGVRSPPVMWGEPLVKNRAHHVRGGDGRSYACQCHVRENGVLAGFCIYSEPMRPTHMHERFLLMNTSQEFLCRFDWDVSGLTANELLNRERECPKSPLTDQQAEAVLTLLTSGV
jgi:BRO family, N-terminal domain